MSGSVPYFPKMRFYYSCLYIISKLGERPCIDVISGD